MIVDCKYKDNETGICKCSGQRLTIPEYEKYMGWICCQTCPHQVSLYTEKDKDAYLLKCLKEIKKDSVYLLCLKLSMCGERARTTDDQYAILHDACIIRLIQLHKRKQLVLHLEFLDAYKWAKRLGIRLPIRSNKIYRRLKKYDFH